MKWAVVALALLAWSASTALWLARGPLISPDSGPYVECARNIREGKGFVIGRFSGLDADRWQPLQVWPPGYPLMIAGLMTGGLADTDAALAVSALAAGITLLLVARVYFAWMPLGVAGATLCAAALMPVFGRMSAMMWSVGPCVALTAASLVCGFEASRRGLDARWLFAAGICAGAAWSVRNLAVALIPAFMVFLVSQTLWTPGRTVLRSAGAWATGWWAAAGWLAVRNLIAFGAINAYAMPPSEKSLGDNLADLSRVVVSDLSTITVGGGRSFVLMAGTAAILVAAVGYAVARRGFAAGRDWLRDHPDVVLFGSYGVFHLTVIVAARTVYRWGESINTGHLVPVYWLLCAALAVGAFQLASALLGDRRRAVFAVVALSIVFTAMQVRATWTTLRGMGPIRYAGISRQAAEALGREVRASQMVLTDSSSSAAALKVFGALNARRLAWVADDPDPLITGSPLEIPALQQAAGAGRVWGFVLTDPARGGRGVFGDAVREIVNDPRRFGFEKVGEEGKVRILRWVGDRRGA